MYKARYSSDSTNIYLLREYIYQIPILIGFIFLLVGLGISQAQANFAVNEPSTVAACPANHKMYYIGASPPTSTPTNLVISTPLVWTDGALDRNYTFTEGSGNKIFRITFSSVIEIYTDNQVTRTSPFFESSPNVSTDAINMYHQSPISNLNRTNHILDVRVNRSVSKVGYKIQDLDSTSVNGLVPYIEQIDVSPNNGTLTFNTSFHTTNANNTIVTGIRGLNCGIGQCNLEAAWNYRLTNTPLVLKHSNTLSEINRGHAVSYSDFYFCLAPPKILIKKALAGDRINDISPNQDQFELSINNGATVVNTVTTTGSGSAVTNNDNRNAVSIAENTSYTITERVRNGTTLGEIANYNATYTCTNATTGSTTVMPTTNMVFNATAKTRSFTLANAAFGDEITCTITNTPVLYTFLGTVFNDNGGMNDTLADANQANFSTGIYNNTKYFNGIFDSASPGPELGIAGSIVKLVNCTTPTTEYATQSVSSTGIYQLTVSAATINNNPNNICLVEVRSDSTYPIRTTPASKTISIVSNTFNYPNNNFGRVIAANTALVLRKAQYVNDCSSTLNYSATNLNTPGNTDPKAGFSESPINGTNGNALTPGQCIAYRITATNRSNLAINDFVMRDVLQRRGVDGALVTSVLANPIAPNSDFASNSVAIGQNNPVITNPLTLNSRTKRDFYFNTKYGTTSGTP